MHNISRGFAYWMAIVTVTGCGGKETVHKNGAASVLDSASEELSLKGSYKSTYAGIDPGMTKRLAAMAYPSRDGYFESCPDAPGGKCSGSLAAGGGFFTLAAGEGQTPQSCRVNSGEYYRNNDQNNRVKCPYHFYWRKEGDSAIARLTADTLPFSDWNTTNIAIALQQTLPTGDVYAGLNFSDIQKTPYVRDIATVSFSFRTRLCRSSRSDALEVARIATYFNFYNDKLKLGNELALNLVSWVSPARKALPYRIPLPDGINTETDLGGPDSMSRTIHVNLAKFGIVPEMRFTDSTSCDRSIDHSPWQSVTIDVPTLLKTVENSGKIDPRVVEDARFAGGIMIGTEHWGKLTSDVELKGYAIKLKSTTTASGGSSSSSGGAASSGTKTCSFNEAGYLAAFPDVAAAVRAGQFQSGLHHWNTYGKNEAGRKDSNGCAKGSTYSQASSSSPSSSSSSSSSGTCSFNEAGYLAAFPDVAAAVRNGQIQSGLHHWNTYGKNEWWRKDSNGCAKGSAYSKASSTSAPSSSSSSSPSSSSNTSSSSSPSSSSNTSSTPWWKKLVSGSSGSSAQPSTSSLKWTRVSISATDARSIGVETNDGASYENVSCKSSGKMVISRGIVYACK